MIDELLYWYWLFFSVCLVCDRHLHSVLNVDVLSQGFLFFAMFYRVDVLMFIYARPALLTYAN